MDAFYLIISQKYTIYSDDLFDNIIELCEYQNFVHLLLIFRFMVPYQKLDLIYHDNAYQINHILGSLEI